MNRSEEELKTGVPVSRASLAISSASRTLAVIGLSMNSGLRAASTGFACARWMRPSLLVRMTASTRRSSSSIEPTSSIFHTSRISAVNFSIRVALASMSGLPPLKAATTRAPGMWSGMVASFISCVNAPACDVSSPISPTRISPAAPCAGGCASMDDTKPLTNATATTHTVFDIDDLRSLLVFRRHDRGGCQRLDETSLTSACT